MTEAENPDRGSRVCRGCGARFPRLPWALDQDLRAAPECWHAHGQVAGFAAEHPAEAGPLLQLGADAYSAQHAGEPTPVIRVAYGLAGLHLALDRGYDGPTVRDVHQRMGKPQDWWPHFEPPAAPGLLTIADVLAAGAAAGSAEGHADAVRRWAASVWATWEPRHHDVAALVDRLFPDGIEAGVRRRPQR